MKKKSVKKALVAVLSAMVLLPVTTVYNLSNSVYAEVTSNPVISRDCPDRKSVV